LINSYINFISQQLTNKSLAFLFAGKQARDIDMIKFFRKIRKHLVDQNKTSKYFKYAIDEIILVVIGILIALQISNWNDSKIQKAELNDVLQSIANGVQSDLRELHLMSSARKNVTVRIDSVINYYVNSNVSVFDIKEASYINFTFTDIANTIEYNPNLSAFESLKNSTYFGEIQGTDLALLLSTYVINGQKIRKRELEFNQDIDDLRKEWITKFKNNGQNLFLKPWEAGPFDNVRPRYLEILRDNKSLNIL